MRVRTEKKIGGKRKRREEKGRRKKKKGGGTDWAGLTEIQYGPNKAECSPHEILYTTVRTYPSDCWVCVSV